MQADALLITLDHQKVLQWLSINGIQPIMPAGTDRALGERAYFVRLFDEAPLFHTLTAAEVERRLVFGLLHSLVIYASSKHHFSVVWKRPAFQNI